MKMIIHDLDKRYEEAIRNKYVKKGEEVIFISDDGTIKHCMGCFGCFIKTPGQCVLNDHYNNMGEIIAKVDEGIVISKCVYGAFSPFVKNVMDRSMPYVHPYFATRNNEMHHKLRYDREFDFNVYFYGDCTEEEKEIAKKTVIANTINFGGINRKTVFAKSMEELIDENIIN